ncbi:MAG: serine protease [Coleofasciculus sp. B1-GNL1-01]|uniref:S1 family peptidase n=1 Tax=Coleofasciculus sp. B1-GNL1-01 TaxID=3068484 RepID=UPI0032F6112A
MSQNFFYGLSAALIGSSAIVVVQPQIAIPQTVDEQAQAIASFARNTTVVINGQNPGSGVIVSRDGNTYYVLTAKHVVATQDEYEIVTSDGVKYSLDYGMVKKLPGLDLALVQFTSDKHYPIALVGDSDTATEGGTVYISGWPHPGRAITQRIFQITSGKISGRPLESLDNGYDLVYTNITRSGMSGGWK